MRVFLKKIYFDLFFGCDVSSLLCVSSLAAASKDFSPWRCSGFSPRWLLLSQRTSSRRMRFSSCGAQAQLLRSLWDPPRPGIEPVYPEPAGKLLTTGPPGKPFKLVLIKWPSRGAASHTC